MSKKNVSCFKFNEFIFDIKNCQLIRDGSPIPLTQKSFEILQFLLTNRGRIVKKEEFLETLWEGSYVEEANLTQHIYMLRKALKQNGGENVYIETIPKNGYRFVAEVKELADKALVGSDGVSLVSTRDYAHEVLSDQILLDADIGNVHNDASFVAADLDETKLHISSFPRLLSIIGIALFLALSIGGYFYINRTSSVGSVGANTRKSVAVLPFRQIDEQKDAKLGLGIADVLIAKLSNTKEVDVRPTTSIMRFSNDDHSDLYDVGRTLAVDCVISGTVQRDKDVVRVTAQLYDVNEKHPVWTAKFDEKYSDVFTLQDKITEKISQKLSAELGVSSTALSYKQETKSAEAYRAYSMGLSYWNMHTAPAFENAVVQFKKAIDLDPHFVMAYAYLADTYAHTTHLSGLMSENEARALGEQAAKDALELDPNCAEAMAALALIYANQDRQNDAFDLMQRSIEIKPNDAHSLHRISWMYANKGNMKKAIEEMRLAQKLDPQSAYLNQFLAEMLLLDRKPSEAIPFLQKALEIEPNSVSARFVWISALEQKGLFAEAEKKILNLRSQYKLENNLSLKLALARGYAKSGRESEARDLLAEVLEKDRGRDNEWLIAEVLIALGDGEKALPRLKSIVKHTKDNIYRVKFEPNFKPVLDDPAFARLLKEKEVEQGW
ncbi:MAG: hypothetical protein HKN25_16755 [Pyrinomonadaceae bacterium]|nr:hypothetical protein [Pyrinomonadaceae bacterium]